MKLPELIETDRLVLRRPLPSDAEAVFSWASDVHATRFISWPRHTTIADSEAFLRFSDLEWDAWPAGPLAIESKSTGQVIGSCGFGFRESNVAEVGYILAPTAWGTGYATESLAAQLAAAAPLGALALGATVHPDNCASMRVLAKCGFREDSSSSATAVFPNLPQAGPVPAIRFVRLLSLPTSSETDQPQSSPSGSDQR